MTIIKQSNFCPIDPFLCPVIKGTCSFAKSINQPINPFIYIAHLKTATADQSTKCINSKSSTCSNSVYSHSGHVILLLPTLNWEKLLKSFLTGSPLLNPYKIQGAADTTGHSLHVTLSDKQLDLLSNNVAEYSCCGQISF